MKKYTITLALAVVFIACGKSNDKDKDDKHGEHHDYYQKNLRFDGFKGEIDSVISSVYEADGLLKGELVSRDVKRFNRGGYVVSHETRAYEDEELFAAGQTVYTRDDHFLESEQLNNYITKTGAGYTLQYILVDRGLNREIWELIRKTPGKDVEVLAEIREYTSNGLRIFTQVGNTDSTDLKYEYKYLETGLDEAILFYNNNVVRQEIKKKYNSENYPIELSTLYRGLDGVVEYEKVERYVYSYDDFKNPILIQIYDEGTLMGIIENEIFYRQ